jgi:phage/plasmid-associated DNA primase
MYKKIESLQTLALVRKDLETDLRDNEFCNKLDQTSGKLIFKDGIYDIETDTFEAGLKYEHFLTYTLPYKYRKPTAEDRKYVEENVMKICANVDWRYNYYMEILGYSMLGMPDKEQAAFFMVGETAGNGKSTLLEALTEMMPNYVVKLNSKTFSEGNNDFKKSINSIKASRIAWINEVQKKKQDVDAIKDIADGKPILNPVLYQQKEEKIQIKSKLFFVSNVEVAFANDAGIKRRYRYVEFIAKFHTQQEHDALQTKRDIDFIRDNAFAEFLVTERGFFALLELILEGARRWCSAKRLVVPEHYIKLANAACEKNDEYAEFVSNNIVKCEGEFVSKFAIEERYKEKYDRKMASEKDVFRKYMASKGFTYDCTKSVRVKVYENGVEKSKVKDGVYMGCKLTEVEETEE